MRRYPILLAVLLLAGCTPAGTLSAAPATPTPVARTTAPSPVPSTTPGVPAPVGPTARACTAADLPTTATIGQSNGAAGTRLNYVVLRNQGRSRCTLAGYPSLLRVDASGNASTVPADQGSPFDPSSTFGTPATIGPGESAQALVTSSMSCDGRINPTTYRNLSIEAAGTSIGVPGLVLQTTCPLRVGAWYRPPASTS